MKNIKTIMKVIGIGAFLALAGYADRGFIDWLGTGALMVLIVPMVYALNKLEEGE